MKKIAISGGKGGVGKSTFSIMLANKLAKNGEKVILADCDIECPNDYLLLEQKLGKTVRKVYAQFPKLNRKKCRKCGYCVSKCRSNAIFQPPGGYPVFINELCSGCSLCWQICPYRAIEVEKKVVGEIFENKVGSNLWLVTGQSVGIVDETGPIVTKSKEYVFDLASRIKADYVLFDTGVGMHCGVIRAIIGADLGYAVTEATPLGGHDLRLILDLFKILGVPGKIVVNQFDLGKMTIIEKISKEKKVEISDKIPYSEKLVMAYSEGKLAKVDLL